LINLNEIISGNFKRIRSEKNLSLDDVAKLTGVSKSMLGQIERCEVNPTITTVWKIANGLKISFTALSSHQESNVEIIKKNESQPFIEEKIKNYPIFSFDDNRRFETYLFEIEPGGNLMSEAHLQGSQEFITVFSGILTVKIGESEYTIANGDSIRFKADFPHEYCNDSHEQVRVSMVIYYEK